MVLKGLISIKAVRTNQKTRLSGFFLECQKLLSGQTTGIKVSGVP